MPNKPVQAEGGAMSSTAYTASNFPIQYPNQSPADDVNAALGHLRTIERALEIMQELFDTIGTEELTEQYCAARRAKIMERA